MFQKYSFIPVFSCLLTGLAWLSLQVDTGPLENQTFHSPLQGESSIPSRQDLIEVLDKVVSYQHYYHSVYGRFTKLMNRIGFTIPHSLSDQYDIRVSEASIDRLIVTAFSEHKGQVVDVASIDQDFQLHTNFKVPEPRADYLKSRALRYMRLLQSAPEGQALDEQGLFKGFFSYTIQNDSQNNRVVSAVGVRPPVLGIHLEFNGNSDGHLLTSLVEGELERAIAPTKIGEQDLSSESTLKEEAFLAQQIFKGEVGRYAKSWSELQTFAHFRFKGKDQFGEDPQSSLDQRTSLQIDRRINSSSSGKTLEIEAIGASEDLSHR